jgi:hypothetical protein
VTLTRNPRPALATARVSGTIAGWSSLPVPLDLSHYNLAVVLYSFTDQWGAPENSITQPMNGDVPKNTCITSALSADPCAWEMNTRTGPQVHMAIIVEGDSKSTTDTSDDTFTLIGYAVKTGLDLSAGQNVTGETLEMVSVATQDVRVTFPSAPSGAPDRLAFPFIDLGAEGQLPFAVPTLAPGSTSTKVPALSGPFASGHYAMVGLALPGDGAPRPYSATFARDSSFASGVSLDNYLATPTNLSAAGDYSFTAASGSSVHIASIADTADNVQWTAVLLDGRTSFSLPANLGAGSYELRVAAVDIPGFDPAAFSFENNSSTIARAAEGVAAFTR